MFLNRKSLIIHNQRRAKNHLEIIKKEVFEEVEKIINEEELSLEHQDSDNLEIFNAAMRNVLLKELKIYNNEQI